MTILFREGMSSMMPTPVVNALIEGSNADIRRIINMISTAKLDEDAMDFDSGKKMTNAWEKNIVLKPWDLTFKILGPTIWAASTKATLNDKADLYFNDHEFSYLMLQENYLNAAPIRANELQGRKRTLETLDLFDKAASSISDGDLVDRMIHGTQQQWSLMPTHAAFSFVRPASFVYGAMGERPTFAGWLGQNSKQGMFSPLKSPQSMSNIGIQENCGVTSKKFKAICAYVHPATGMRFGNSTCPCSGIAWSAD